MGWFTRRSDSSSTPPDNMTQMTGVFRVCLNDICNNLNRCLAAPGVFGERIGFKIENASNLEVGLYLLFRLDLNMYRERQRDDIRHALFKSCMKSILPSDDNHYVDLAYNRLGVYSDIFNKAVASDGTWGPCDDWLINAILVSGNDYRKMSTDVDQFVLDDIGVNMHMKMAFNAVESVQFVLFDTVFKHVFAGCNNFMQLTLEELLARIEKGKLEARAIWDQKQ